MGASRSLRASAAAASLWLVACSGEVGGGPGDPPAGGAGGDTGGAGGGSGTGGGGPPPGPPPGQCAAPSPGRIWRLSHTEYNNTIAALLGDTSAPGSTFEPQSSGTGFANGSEAAQVSKRLASDYKTTAEKLAAAAATSAAIGRLLPCTPADPANAACVQMFIERFGKRTFRQPLTPEQKALYLGVYNVGRPNSPSRGVAMVVEAMLQSPYFLYRTELGGAGPKGQPVALTAHEMASQLAYLAWETMPDDPLLAKADMNALATPRQVADELDRMLADPRAKGVIWRFVAQYFDVDVNDLGKDMAVYPSFTPALADLLGREAEAFVNHVVSPQGSGGMTELFTADYSFFNQALAAHYGVTGVAGADLRKVNHVPGQRSGILTHAGVLAAHAKTNGSSPTLRGHFVRTQLLCQDIPPPPPNVADVVEPPGAVKTTRQRYEAHLSVATCRSCHSLLDPIGFGFEHYDGIGKYRARENGADIDPAGEIIATQDINGTFRGALELGKRLATSKEVAACTAKNFFRYAMGRIEAKEDACVIDAMRDRFDMSGTRLLDLLRGLAQTDAFMRRVKI